MKNSAPGVEELRLVAEHMPAAAAHCGHDRRFIWVNPLYAKWVGRRAEDIAGRTLEEVLGAPIAHEIEPYVSRVLAGESARYERRVDLPGLRGRWVSTLFTPAPAGWISVAIDIDAYKLAEQQKDEFLATLAHELRNPLAPIRNAVAILGRKGSQDPEVAWRQTVIERQIDQLSRLIDDLLDIERISRGRFLLKKEHVPLEFIVDMAIEASRPIINAAGHHLSVLLPSERVVLDADAARLSHVLTILLKNAARHMQSRGSIGLTASVEGASVFVAIEDGCVGLDSERERVAGRPRGRA